MFVSFPSAVRGAGADTLDAGHLHQRDQEHDRHARFGRGACSETKGLGTERAQGQVGAHISPSLLVLERLLMSFEVRRERCTSTTSSSGMRRMALSRTATDRKSVV